VTFVTSPVTQTAVGAGFSITVSAEDKLYGTAMPNYAGTVHFTSSDGAAVLPPDYTFTGADNGSHTFTFALNEAGPQTITITDTTYSSWQSTTAPIQVGTPISGGWSLIDLPLDSSGSAAPITSASILAGSLDDPGNLGPNAVAAIATYTNSRFQLYVPGYSADLPLAPTQGIFVLAGAGGTWLAPGTAYAAGQAVTLQPGWNLVAAPFPATGLMASGISSQVSGCGVQEIATYTGGSYQTWLPGGTDVLAPAVGGFWMECMASGTWTPR
jgi:hypothetical protein